MGYGVRRGVDGLGALYTRDETELAMDGVRVDRTEDGGPGSGGARWEPLAAPSALFGYGSEWWVDSDGEWWEYGDPGRYPRWYSPCGDTGRWDREGGLELFGKTVAE